MLQQRYIEMSAHGDTEEGFVVNCRSPRIVKEQTCTYLFKISTKPHLVFAVQFLRQRQIG